MLTIAEIADAWRAFFFDPVPVHSVAVFRIGISFFLLIDAFFLLANARELLGPKGFLSYDQFYRRNRRISFSLFLYLPPTMSAVYFVLGVHIGFLMLVLLGLFTPVSVIVVYMTLTSLVNRNLALCNGGDVVARVMWFLLIFASSGHAFSLDEYLFYRPNMPDKEYLMQAPWALRLMQIQLCVIYLRSVYWKLKGRTYRNGTALYYALRNDTYARMSVPAFLLQKPLIRFLTWGVLAAEVFLGVGLWIRELQYPAIATGFLLHMSIELTLNVHLFGWLMMTSLLLFIDPSDWMRLVQSM